MRGPDRGHAQAAAREGHPRVNMGQNSCRERHCEQVCWLRRTPRCGACSHEGHGNAVRAAVRGTATQCTQPQGARRHGVCSREGQGNAVGAAARGMAMWCVQPRGARQCSGHSHEGHSNTMHAVMKAQQCGAGEEAMRRVRVQGHGDAGHVSIIMLFRPCHVSSPSWSVVGPGGPSRERADLLVSKEG